MDEVVGAADAVARHLLSLVGDRPQGHRVLQLIIAAMLCGVARGSPLGLREVGPGKDR